MVVKGHVTRKDITIMIDSRVTHKFIALQAVEWLQLLMEENLSMLELADGSKFISEGKYPNVLFTLQNYTFKVQAIVTKLFKGLALILGMTWLEQVNPFIDWTSKKIFIQQDKEGN